MSLQWVSSSADVACSVNIRPSPDTPDFPSDQTIAEVAERLNELRHSSAMNLTLDIGAVVVDRIFMGSLERVHARGRKDASFRKLAAYPNLPFSPMRLWRAVGVYELVSRMPGVAKNTNLSVSHLYAVLGLPHQTQEWLLRATVEQKWTVATLDHKARKHRSAGGGGARRSAPPPFLTSLKRVERLTERIESAVLGGDDEDELDPEQLRRARESVGRIRAWCEDLEKALGLSEEDR